MSVVPYHHGNLRESLIEAATELAAVGGPDDVVIREVARQVGVSHNAAYRHFADRDALLRAVAARAMSQFGALMVRRIEQAGTSSTDPMERAYAELEACGRAYVEFAGVHTGLFRTAMAYRAGDVEPDTDVTHPYAQLGERLDRLVETGAITSERRANAEIAAFSAVHGFAMLSIAGSLGTSSDAERERDLAEVIRVVRYGI